MEQLIVYQNEDQTIVLHVNDEPEFIARYFGAEGIDWEEWERIEVTGPLEVGRPAAPEIYDVYENYDI